MECNERRAYVPLLVLIAGLLAGCAGIREGSGLGESRDAWILGTWMKRPARQKFVFRADGTFVGPGIVTRRERYHSKELPEFAYVDQARLSSIPVSGAYTVERYRRRRGFRKEKLRRLVEKHGMKNFKQFSVLTLSYDGIEKEYVIGRPFSGRGMAIVMEWDSKYPFKEFLVLDYAGPAE